MTVDEIKQLAAEPGVQSVEVRPDGTVVIVKCAPIYSYPSAWPTWIAPVYAQPMYPQQVDLTPIITCGAVS